jgi:long-chain acyl-CoA synthetase
MPNGPALGTRVYNPVTKTYGGYEWQTYVEVNARITRFGSGLIKIHQDAHSLPTVSHRWSVGIWAINRAEWTIASEACSAYNLVSVGLYDTLGPEAVVYGVNHSECSVIVTSGKMTACFEKVTKQEGTNAMHCLLALLDISGSYCHTLE